MFQDLNSNGLVVPGWLEDKGNNTWWAHSGGIHPAMPGAAMPKLQVKATPFYSQQPKAADSSGTALECPMCSTLTM